MAEPQPTPLDVMLQTMRLHLQAGELDEAIAAAKAAAPYIHPKPAPGKTGQALNLLKDDQLDELCGNGVDGEAPAPDDQVKP